MRETISMTARDQQRTYVLTRLVAGDLAFEEAVALLGLSSRQVWRLKAGFLREGPGALVHGNRGRASPRRTGDELRARVVELARTRYDGANDSHLAELLAEREGIELGRVTVRRILRSAGVPSPRRRRPPRHRSRRDRMPQAGLLLQLDGSRHDWLEARGPVITRVGPIDDATGLVPAATFRDEEDAAGYFEILRTTFRRHGLPAAVYRDRHGAFEHAERELPAELRLADTRAPTQVGRALGEPGIRSIAARSPQAKGRIERLWGTFQDRLVTELRLAGAVDREAANAVLARYLPRHNRRFSVEPASPEPAWRPVPPEVDLDHILSFRYRRVVANDHTVRVGGLVLDLPRVGGRGYAGRRVEVSLRLDGRLVVSDGGRRLLVCRAPVDPARLRSLESARAGLDRAHPATSPAPGYAPGPDHPWRRVRPGTKLHEVRQQEARLTKSQTR
jgi:transposase